MAVTIKIDGFEVICDTPAEATQMVMALRTPQKPAQQAAATHVTQASIARKMVANAFREFWEDLEYNQKTLLREVAKAYPSPVIAESLATELDVDINQVGWVRRKMNVVASRVNLDLGDYMEHSKELQGESIKTAYKAKKNLVDELAILDRSQEPSQVGSEGG